MPACPKCVAPAPARHDTRPLLRLALDDDGRLRRESEPTRRFRCGACGHVFAEDTGGDATIVETVVASTLRTSITSAARSFGCDESTIARMLRDWLADRDRRLPPPPDIVAFAPLRVLGRPCWIATSPADTRLVDLVSDREPMDAWAARRGPAPSTACIPVDPQLDEALARIVPPPSTAVTPSVARRAIEAAGIASFRTMVRDLACGRNFKEPARLLRKPDPDLDDAERDDLRFWHPRIRQFRAVYQSLLAGLGAAATGFASACDAASAWLARNAPTCPLTRLLDRWAPHMIRGVALRWTEPSEAMTATLADEVRRLRPTAGFDVLRAILMFGHDERGAPDILDAAGALRGMTPARA